MKELLEKLRALRAHCVSGKDLANLADHVVLSGNNWILSEDEIKALDTVIDAVADCVIMGSTNEI